MMTTSANGRALIEEFEGLRLNAYLDVRGIPTIGYGHTGPNVHLGLTITQAQADIFLEQDLATAEWAVNHFVHQPLSQNEFDALVCFTYNVGVGSLQHSTLLQLVNAGDFARAAQQFPLWDKADGVTEPGLFRRRLAEQQLFLTL